LAPKSTTSTTMTISQCTGLSDPMIASGIGRP